MMRLYRLFDELGRPDELGDYPEVFLQEDLATGLLPPIHNAADGVVDCSRERVIERCFV